jgi:hypothetical protein
MVRHSIDQGEWITKKNRGQRTSDAGEETATATAAAARSWEFEPWLAGPSLVSAPEMLGCGGVRPDFVECERTGFAGKQAVRSSQSTVHISVFGLEPSRT